ncbi:hypothetical protein C8J56DRAFT_1104056 [Mycena floridula]|nr:hypothetical protein C8J56DRAFT_1104056 [Mycena floridula]
MMSANDKAHLSVITAIAANQNVKPAENPSPANSALSNGSTGAQVKAQPLLIMASQTIPRKESQIALQQSFGLTYHDIVDYVFNFIGIAAAVIFGIWSIKAYDATLCANRLSTNALDAANVANNLAQDTMKQAMKQALLSNQLAMLAFCFSNNGTDLVNSTCMEFTSKIIPILPSIVAGLVPAGPGSPGGPTSSPPAAALQGFAIAVIVIVVLVALLGFGGVILWGRKQEKVPEYRKQSSP